MRSDNLRAAPGFFTPGMVQRVLEQLDKPQVVDPAGVPVVKITLPKPTLRIVSETRLDPPSGGKIRLGMDGPKEKPGAVALPSSGAARAASAEPASPAISPDEHARRAEGEEAAPPPPPPSGGRWAGHVALHLQAEFRQLATIAHRRGIALHDLALAIGKPKGSVAGSCDKLGLQFSFRAPLADPLTQAELIALADEAIPLPELRRDRLRAEALKRKALAERDRRAAAATTRICEATHRTPRQAVRSAAPREPASPAPQQARAHPLSDRDKYDRASDIRSQAVRRRIQRQAAAILDGDASAKPKGQINSALAGAMIEVRERRAAEARQSCPIETAKSLLRRRFAPVCSMAVYGGDADLFCIGHRKDVTREELLAMAAKVAA